jgi:RNA polymerase sigma-70 factor (ECF subfamily)
MTGSLHPSRAAGPADDDEFAGVYQAHFEYAWACLRRLGVPLEAQEDAVQDLFLVVYRRLPAFAGRSSVKTWIFGIARKVAGRYRRTEARRLRRHERLATIAADDPAIVGEEEVLRREARRMLAEFLDELDDDRRALFVLHIFEDLSGPEIAEVLGLNLNTVYSRLRAIRAQFDRTFAVHREAALLVARDSERPPEDAQRRAWCALAGQLGGSTAAAPGLVQAAATGKLAGAPWALGLVGAAVLAAIVGAPPAPAVRPHSPDPDRSTNAHTSDRPPAATPRLDSEEPAAASAIRPTRPAARRPVAPIASTPVMTADMLAAETALMTRVRAAVAAGQHDEALALLQQHALAYPQGVLQRERQGFRAIALCHTGQKDAGRSEGAAFLRDHPEIALAAQLRAACEIADLPPY